MSKFNWVDEGYFAIETRDLAKIRSVLVITMLLNFLASFVKMAVGVMTGALSVIADGLDSLFDGLSNVIGLAGLYAASRPPDAEHPYGHRKFETIAALSIAFLLFFTCWQLLEAAWNRFGSNVIPEISLWIIAALIFSMLVQVGTSYFELRKGRQLQSEMLIADALHTRASILVSLSVLGGLGLVYLGYPRADPILAAFVAIFIAKIGIDVLRETLPILVDQAAVDPWRIANVVKNVEGVKSLHRVRSRGAAGSAAVDLHVQVSPEHTLQEANAIADEVRRRLLDMDDVTDVTVHLEPHRDTDTGAADIFAKLRYAANEYGLVVHEAWVQSLDGNLYTELHVGVKPQMSLGEAHTLVDRFEKEMRIRLPQLQGVHTHIELGTMDIQVLDRAPLDLEEEVRREVNRLIASNPSLKNPHNITVRRDRGSGDKLFISLECTVSPDIPVVDAHDLASTLEEELRRSLKDVAEVSIHLEPPGES